jgi:hypothetical protein
MGKPNPKILKFMETYKVDSDEVWEVRAGGAWAIKHSALERVAAEAGITFEIPQFAEKDGSNKTVAMLIVGKMGDRTEWSIGEAAPGNNKNAYPYAMAEKRGKDRVILKLLNSHGTIYSEEEADDFAASNSSAKATTLPKKDAKEIYTKMQGEIRACQSREQLKLWGEANKDRIAILPEDWQDILRLQYEEMSADLRNREAA